MGCSQQARQAGRRAGPAPGAPEPCWMHGLGAALARILLERSSSARLCQSGAALAVIVVVPITAPAPAFEAETHCLSVSKNKAKPGRWRRQASRESSHRGTGRLPTCACTPSPTFQYASCTAAQSKQVKEGGGGARLCGAMHARAHNSNRQASTWDGPQTNRAYLAALAAAAPGDVATLGQAAGAVAEVALLVQGGSGGTLGRVREAHREAAGQARRAGALDRRRCRPPATHHRTLGLP